jgi:hypothetical protein
MPACNDRGSLSTRDVRLRAVVMKRLGKHFSAVTTLRNNRRAVFSVRSVPRDYKKDKKIVGVS